MSGLLGNVTAVVMAKRPTPGRVLTRLATGGWPDETIVEVAWALLRCTAQRLRASGRLVLAVAPDGAGRDVARQLGVDGVEIVDQGEGDLGERIVRVWGAVAPDRPVAFFGYDSPDLPSSHLAAIPEALERCDAAAGPVPDGGYWTIAARRCLPELMMRIDWGTESVYDQTCRRAEKAGLTIASLLPWEDVDHPDELSALHRRLHRLSAPELAQDPAGDALQTLAARLDELLGEPSAPKQGGA